MIHRRLLFLFQMKKEVLKKKEISIDKQITNLKKYNNMFQKFKAVDFKSGTMILNQGNELNMVGFEQNFFY